MAFVDVAESRNNAEQRCDFIMRMLLFFLSGVDKVFMLITSSSAVDCYHSGCFRQPTMISA